MSRIFLSPADVGAAEREALLAAFDGGWIAPVGPELNAFEAAVANSIGWPAAVALSSGTAALHLALLDVGVAAGDRVYVSSFTFAATANAVVYCQAVPVFIDSEAASWNMCPELLREALVADAARGTLPAAVLVVDLYGQCADYDRIQKVCREFDVPIVEDAAEALGSTYRGRAAGTLGDIGVFSFNGNKIITTSGGGMLVTSTIESAERARHLATQAREPVVHYEHHEVGFNYRMSNLLAALGLAQFSRLGELSSRKLAIRDLYATQLGHLEFMPTPEWSAPNGWLTCVLFDDSEQRDAAMARLATEDIESRPLWKPMHLQPVFSGADTHVNGVSDDLFARGLCLPSGAALAHSDVERISALVRAT